VKSIFLIPAPASHLQPFLHLPHRRQLEAGNGTTIAHIGRREPVIGLVDTLILDLATGCR
jgi:hypothetical protein